MNVCGLSSQTFIDLVGRNYIVVYLFKEYFKVTLWFRIGTYL